MDNDERANLIINKFGFSFNGQYRKEIIQLLEAEIENYQLGSSEYLRVLCGLLFCIGNKQDVEIIKRIKYGINMDVGCMIDAEWIASLEESEEEWVRSRQELIEDFISYYKEF